MTDLKLTPREPTAAMIEAGEELFPCARGTESRAGQATPEAIWRAMHDAASSPEPLPAGELDDDTLVMLMLAELHANVPEDQRPMGFCDLSDDQAERARKAVAAIKRALSRQPAPVQMLLFCPKCGMKHVDAPDERTPDWTNPPHKSHLCHGCGCIWRPADVPTEGVEAITTIGKADTIDLNAVSRQPTLDSAGEAVTQADREAYRAIMATHEEAWIAAIENRDPDPDQSADTAAIAELAAYRLRALASSRDGRVEGLREAAAVVGHEARKYDQKAGGESLFGAKLDTLVNAIEALIDQPRQKEEE